MSTRLATGCISIAVETGAPIVVDRMIEYLELHDDSAVIWVDIFLRNPHGASRSLLVLHRGSLQAENVTDETWSSGAPSKASFASALRQRIMRLHETFAPISWVPSEDRVIVGEQEYEVWQGPQEPEVVVGDDRQADVPFTMWRVASFMAGHSYVLRLRLSMSPGTFKNQIGDQGLFYAYGEAILLRKIEDEDLPRYQEESPEQHYQVYHDAFFPQFKRAAPAVPDFFEYLVVCQEGTKLGWETTALSPMTFPQPITAEELRANTRWFVYDSSQSDKWSLVGKRYNGMVVRVDKAA